MAMRFQVETTLQAPPEEVFRRTTDLDALGAWMPGFVRVERLSDAGGVGTRYRLVRTLHGREASEVFEVKADEPPHRRVIEVDGREGSSGRGTYRFVHGFEAIEGGAATRYRIGGTIEGMGVMGALLGWMFKGVFAKALRRDQAALKAWIEAPDA